MEKWNDNNCCWIILIFWMWIIENKNKILFKNIIIIEVVVVILRVA